MPFWAILFFVRLIEDFPHPDRNRSAIQEKLG